MKYFITTIIILTTQVCSAFSLRFNLLGYSNLIKNGNFDLDVNQWILEPTSGGSFSWENSHAVLTQNDPAPLVYQQINTKINHKYKCTIEVISGIDYSLKAYSTLPARTSIGDLAQIYITNINKNNISISFIATTQQSFIGIKSEGGSNGRSMIFDTIFCRDI